MRLLLIHAFPRFVVQMARQLGGQVTALMETADHAREVSATGADLQVAHLPVRSKVDVVAISAVRRALRHSQPDLIHAFYGKALATALWSTLAQRSPPPIVSFRGIQRVPSYRDPGEWVTYLHPRVAGHTCESQAVAHALQQAGIRPARCATIYNYVAPDFPRPGRSALAAWKVPAEAFVVGTVANMRPVKGVDLLLRAFHACADLPTLHLVLIGAVQDPQLLPLASHPAIRDRVHWLGPRTDAVSLASGFDLFVMPSRQEALCRALLEAMSQGICPVVSDAGGLPEAVRQGQDGWVFPRESVPALADILRRAFRERDLVRRFSESAYQRAREEFSAERMVERTLPFYRRLVASPE